MLDLSQIQAGQMAPRREALDLAELARSCRGLVSTQATKRGVEIVVEVPDALPVLADKAMVMRVLLNLLLNAVEFSAEGGRVAVRVAAEASATPWVMLTVADGGIGMTPEQVEIALSPFRQIDGGLTRRREGAGLGLPIAKSLVELHGGTLAVDSVLGRGTTVRVRLPVLVVEPTGA
ncbi:hypothetical protein GCM10011611_54730 [Aliidongia dinghuensis]|uniref:histidine kinase n=1 Tax=Aliidongia dinghuensis TaxID=1867774 RepID=A0A8J2YYJ5_9PROT|nr:HAMP domain-containing sensor histidine kinase [Aliidongia dinghuensis]GGF41360.1 hypothetical protein GCM10011611_54730 [Aliidongia dinghuensis]